MSNPDLSIIILNYKMDGLVKNCLKSLFEHSPRIKREIIVVDNGSNDQIETIIQEQFPQVTFIQAGKNLGHAKGNNLGIQAASGRHIMVLNPDTVFLEDVFDQVVDFMDANKRIGISTLQLRNPDGSLQPGAWKFHKFITPFVQRSRFLRSTSFGTDHAHEFEMKSWNRESSKDVDWVQGSCMIVRRELIDAVGAFDERFFLYFTDVDWCRRAWDAGWRVHYHADASVIHYYHRESNNESLLQSLKSKALRLHVKDWIRYLNKYRFNLRPKL